MKKSLLITLSLLIYYLAFADDNLLTSSLSERAQELNEKYQARLRPNSSVHRDPWVYPPINREVHFTEEYRPAWEELYREKIIHGVNIDEVKINHVYIINALSEIASTNTIPMLKNIYTQLLETDKDASQKQQKEILDILLKFKAYEAIDAVFLLLDLSDTKYGDNSPYKIRTNITLRESVWQDMLNPTPAMTLKDQKERTERAEQWREKFNVYQNPKLSENNKMFMEKARNLSRTPEERNTSADVPLP